MTEPVDLVLEHLRAIRAKVDTLDTKVDEINTRLTLMDENLAGIHREIGNLYALYAAQSKRQDRMDAQLARIERRLELREAPSD